MDWINSLVSFWPIVASFLVTALGAALMWLYSLDKGFRGAVERLQQLIPGRSVHFYHRLDFGLTTVIGGIVGQILFDPADSNPVQQLAAGLGWAGALTVLASSKGPRDQQAQHGTN